MMPYCRHRGGPLVSFFKSYAAEECTAQGTRSATLVKWAERNRGETFSTYRYEAPLSDPSWLGVQVEVCLETYPAYHDMWRRRHNGNTEGDWVRLETRMSHVTYPYRIEEVEAFLCDGEGPEPEGGTKLSRFYAIGCQVTDKSGTGAKFEALGEEDKEHYDSTVYLLDIFHKKRALEEKPATMGCRLHFPTMDKPFTPTRAWMGMIHVRWAFGDIYNTLFHPMISDVLALAHRQSNWDFVAGLDLVSLYLKMFGRVAPGRDMEVFLFIDVETLTEVYFFKSFEERLPAWAGVAQFDPENSRVYQEPMQAAMMLGPHLMSWLMGDHQGRADGILDLSKCRKF